MPDDPYSLSDLARLADVTPRTVRYYVALGLLPSPEAAGPATRYGEGHLARLRLIRRLQRDHLPLAEIRIRLERMGDDEIIATVSALDAREPDPSQDPGDTLAFVRSLMQQSGIRPTVADRRPCSRRVRSPAGDRRVARCGLGDRPPPLRRCVRRRPRPLRPPASPAPAASGRESASASSPRPGPGPHHLGAPRHHPGRRAPRPPAAGPDDQQARRPAGADRPGAVRRPLAPDPPSPATPANPTTRGPGSRDRHAQTRPIRALTTLEKEAHRDPAQQPRPPRRPAPRRPPRPPPHPRRRPQRALPAHRRRRAHRGAGSGAAPPAGQPRLRPRPLRVDGRAQQARPRQAGRARGDPPPRAPRTASPS